MPNRTQQSPVHAATRGNGRSVAAPDARARWHAEQPQAIGHRLRECDAAWDIGRGPEAKAATLALTETMLALTIDRGWLALPCRSFGSSASERRVESTPSAPP